MIVEEIFQHTITIGRNQGAKKAKNYYFIQEIKVELGKIMLSKQLP